MLQDSEGPRSLSDLCLSQVCHSLDALCSRRTDGSMCLSRAPLFPQEVADQLLHNMATSGGSEELKRLTLTVNKKKKKCTKKNHVMINP